MTSLSTIIQLYRGGQFHWWNKPPTNHWQTLLHHVVWSTSHWQTLSHLAMSGIRTHNLLNINIIYILVFPFFLFFFLFVCFFGITAFMYTRYKYYWRITMCRKKWYSACDRIDMLLIPWVCFRFCFCLFKRCQFLKLEINFKCQSCQIICSIIFRFVFSNW